MDNINKPRILVVDDDISWQGLYKEELDDSGFDVTVVGSKTDAEKAITQRMFHVAIVDIRLNEKDKTNVDGLHILEKIWMLDEGTEAVLVTGYTEDMLKQFREFQMFGFQNKSLLTPEDLLRESRSAAFLRSYFNKNDGLSAIIKEVQRVAPTAITNGNRKKWAASPFASMRGYSQVEIQRKLMSGQMAELRPFLGDLCRAYFPWLKSNKEMTPIIFDNRTIGFEFRIWSRSRGEPLVIRFGRNDHQDQILAPAHGTPKDLKRSQIHYVGAVFGDDIDFDGNFEYPMSKRTSSAVFSS